MTWKGLDLFSCKVYRERKVREKSMWQKAFSGNQTHTHTHTMYFSSRLIHFTLNIWVWFPLHSVISEKCVTLNMRTVCHLPSSLQGPYFLKSSCSEGDNGWDRRPVIVWARRSRGAYFQPGFAAAVPCNDFRDADSPVSIRRMLG